MVDAQRVLEGGLFEDEVFRGGDLAAADLRDKELCRCTFDAVKLTESRWRGARLEDCTFKGCELSRFSPAGLVARDVTFIDCKMMGVEWAELGAYPALGFRGCDLRYGSFVSLTLRKLVFERCDLRESAFVDADLLEARFPECQLGGARFERCDLRRASFEGARDLALEPAGNRLGGARVPVDVAVRLAQSFGLEVIGA